MPRLTEAMKDVISCDKLRVGANNLWSEDFRMGQPGCLKNNHLRIVVRANPGNWNILVPGGRENKLMIPSVVASERGRAQTAMVAMPCRGSRTAWSDLDREEKVLESTAIAGESPLSEAWRAVAASWVTRDTSNLARIRRDHPVRLNTRMRPIVNEYREGKVKSTSIRRVK